MPPFLMQFKLVIIFITCFTVSVFIKPILLDSKILLL